MILVTYPVNFSYRLHSPITPGFNTLYFFHPNTRDLPCTKTSLYRVTYKYWKFSPQNLQYQPVTL